MYIVKQPAAVPTCALTTPSGRGLGAVVSSSATPELQTSTMGLVLIGAGSLLAGYALHSLIVGGRRAVRRRTARLRRRTRRAKEAIRDLSSRAIAHQTPTWQTLLLVGVAGAAVYFITTRVLKGGQQA